MWLLFGVIAIVSAILNVIQTAMRRDARWFQFISLSCTALTVCGLFSLIEHKYTAGDWSALMDILPGMSKVLWFLTAASIVINSISLFHKRSK